MELNYLPYITKGADEMKDIPQGVGLYVWTIKALPVEFFQKIEILNLDWLAVKVSEGVNSFNLKPLSTGGYEDTILEPWVWQARDHGYKVYGWGYVYGFNPLSEAEKAAERVNKFKLDGFIIDAEGEYNGKHSEATRYMKTLRNLLPDKPLALSSYRFPSVHPNFPFEEFIEKTDFHAPQAYWNEGRAAPETERTYEEYQAIKMMPFVPAGRAFYEGSFPPPTAEEIKEFYAFANKMEFPALFFWSADFLYHRLPTVYGKMTPARSAIASNRLNVNAPPPAIEKPDQDGYDESTVLHCQLWDGDDLKYSGDVLLMKTFDNDN